MVATGVVSTSPTLLNYLTTNKMTTKTIKKEYRLYRDLYGDSVFIGMLKNAFKSVCFTDKSIPSAGSPVRSSKAVKDDLRVNKAIFHRNNEITIFTDNGNLRFF